MYALLMHHTVCIAYALQALLMYISTCNLHCRESNATNWLLCDAIDFTHKYKTCNLLVLLSVLTEKNIDTHASKIKRDFAT